MNCKMSTRSKCSSRHELRNIGKGIVYKKRRAQLLKVFNYLFPELVCRPFALRINMHMSWKMSTPVSAWPNTVYNKWGGYFLTWTWTYVTRWCFWGCTITHISTICRSRIIAWPQTRSCPTATRDVTGTPVVPTRPCSIHLLEKRDLFTYTNISLSNGLKVSVSIKCALTYTCNAICKR